MISLILVPGFQNAGPANQTRYSESAFPGGSFFTMKGCGSTVGPADHLSSVIGAVDHDGVVGDAEFVQLVEEHSNVFVVLNHTIGIESDARNTL